MKQMIGLEIVPKTFKTYPIPGMTRASPKAEKTSTVTTMKYCLLVGSLW